MANPDDPVAAFYGRYPYPRRSAEKGAGDLAWIRPSSLPVVAHHVFGGVLPRDRALRLLVAGGGTGDAVIGLGGWLQRLGIPGHIDYVDLSERSCAIARRRADAHGLTTVSFRVAPLEALGDGPPQLYDYIDCCGVLNHVSDQAAALAVLAHVLAPGGGIGLMAYGSLGRSGVYEAQAALSMLGVDASRPDAVPLARAFVQGLPKTNWLLRNPGFQAVAEADEAELADVLLNPRDRAFDTDELDRLVTAAGLRIRCFTPPFLYDPASALRDPALRAAAAGLDRRARWRLAELLQGSLRKHVFYAVGDDGAEPADPAADPAETLLDDPGTLLVPAGIDPPALAATLRPVAERRRGIGIDIDGRTVSAALPLSALGLDLLARIDGPTPVGAVLDGCAAAPAEATSELRALQRRLTQLGLLYIMAV